MSFNKLSLIYLKHIVESEYSQPWNFSLESLLWLKKVDLTSIMISFRKSTIFYKIAMLKMLQYYF